MALIPREAMLDVWIQLGCPSLLFDSFMDDPRRTPADAWAQLLAAISGNVNALCRDTNPPAPNELIDAARQRHPMLARQ